MMPGWGPAEPTEEIARRPPDDAYWCPVMFVSANEDFQVWTKTNPLERWAHEHWLKLRQQGTIWDFDRGCWIAS